MNVINEKIKNKSKIKKFIKPLLQPAKIKN